MRKEFFYLLLFLCIIAIPGKAQQADSLISPLQNFPASFYLKVDKKISGINDQLSKKSLKYLAKFQRQERKLREKLVKLNPESVVENANEKYNELSQKIKSKTGGAGKIISGEYIANLDSLGTSLSFLRQFNDISDKVKEPLKSFDLLQSKLQQSEKIKEFISERKNQIKEILSKYTKLPAGLRKEYDKLSKTAYYYQAQVKEYKEMLKDPKKIEWKALSLLNKLPAFQKFMKENGQLASLFRIPDNSAEPIPGLQTRASVQDLLQQHFGEILSPSPNAGGAGRGNMQQQMQQVQTQLNIIKDKINQLGGGNSDMAMPEFIPDNQKTKSFLERLEYSLNIQSQRGTINLPAISDIAVALGYKLSDKKTIGIGASYKLGWGHGFNDIHFTSEGVSLRSYADLKFKGSIWITGGFENNYYQQFSNFRGLKNSDIWQRSALAGLTKKYKVGKKESKIQLLYDFLANKQLPHGQVLKFRVGYNF